MRITSITHATLTYLRCSQYCMYLYEYTIIRVQAPKFLNLFDTMIHQMIHQ